MKVRLLHGADVLFRTVKHLTTKGDALRAASNPELEIHVGWNGRIEEGLLAGKATLHPDDLKALLGQRKVKLPPETPRC